MNVARRGQASVIAAVFLVLAFLGIMAFFAAAELQRGSSQQAQLKISQLLDSKAHESLVVVANSTRTVIFNDGSAPSLISNLVLQHSDGTVSFPSAGVTLSPTPYLDNATGVSGNSSYAYFSSKYTSAGYARIGVFTSLGNVFWQQGFSVGANQTTLTVVHGYAKNVTISVTFDNFPHSVGLYVGGPPGMPAGMSASFSSVLVGGPAASSGLLVQTDPSIHAGSYPLKVCGVAMQLTECVQFTVVVT